MCSNRGESIPGIGLCQDFLRPVAGVCVEMPASLFEITLETVRPVKPIALLV